MREFLNHLPRSDHPCGHAGRDAPWRQIARHDRTCTDDAADCDRNTVEYRGARADPAVVVDADPEALLTLCADRHIEQCEAMILREDPCARTDNDVVTYRDPTLSAKE
jgi:hypothetical protein